MVGDVVSEITKAGFAINEQVQKIRDTRDACRNLGKRAIRITLKIGQYMRTHENNETITKGLKDFRKTLGEIQDVMNDRLSGGLQNKVDFVVRNRKIDKKTKELEKKLDVTMAFFSLEVSLDNSSAFQRLKTIIAEDVVLVMQELKAASVRIEEQQLALLPTHDGFLRHIGRDALVLRSRLDPLRVHATLRRKMEIIKRTKAVLMTPSDPVNGIRVILHKYASSEGDFADTLVIARAWHQHILPIFGRSPARQMDAPYIVFEDYLNISYYRPFEEYSSSLNGFDHLREMLLALHDLCEVVDYLEEENLHDCIAYDKPTSPWVLHDDDLYLKRDVEQSELVFDLRTGRIKWKLGCPVLDEPEVVKQRRNRAPLFCLPALRSIRKQLMEQLKAGMKFNEDGPDVVDKWFNILQGPQSCPLGLHRIVTHQEPSDMELLVPVGTWLVQPLISSGSSQWSPLETDDLDVHPPQSLWSLPLYEEHGSEEAPLTADTSDTRSRIKISLPDAYNYDTYAHTGFRHETSLFFEELTTWTSNCFPSFLSATTVSFSQHVRSKFKMSQVSPSLNERILNNDIVIVTAATYIVETTLVRSACAEQREPAPMWFFILEHDNIYDPFSRCNVPWGFWSTEESPTSIPSLLSAPSVQGSDFPFVWNQELGDHVFCIRARVVLENTALTENEALVLKQCYGTARHVKKATVDERIGQVYEGYQGEDHRGGSATTLSVTEYYDVDQGDESTLGKPTVNKDDTKSEGASEAAAKGEEKEPEKAHLHSRAVVSFLVMALFFKIAPSFVVVPCLVLAPIIIAFASHIQNEPGE